MHHHAPDNYECPFCGIVEGREHEGWSVQEDIFYRDELVVAWVSLMRWPNNPGNVIIVPKEHYENVYEMPDELVAATHILAKRVAVAMKGCMSVRG